MIKVKESYILLNEEFINASAENSVQLSFFDKELNSLQKYGVSTLYLLFYISIILTFINSL